MGDITIFGGATREVMRELASLGVPVVLIHGNHEDEDELRELAERYESITWAHGRAVIVKGLRFIGFGGHGFRQREPELEEIEERLASEFNPRTIVLSHAPPYETKLDEAMDDWHVGNQSLSDLILRRKPMLVLCGHIHNCFHIHDVLGRTTLINPGPDGEIIEVPDE